MRHLIKNITLIGALSALLFSCEKDGKKQEFYYPEPIVTGIYPTTGYTLSQVVINGENFGDRLEPVSVHFGDKKAEIVSCKNNRIIVVVPKDAVSGDVTLKVWQYEFDNVGKFTVVPKPTIISVSSSNTDCPLFAAENDVITITGISFGTNKEDITVKIGTKIAEVISIQDDEIQVRTPAGYGIGTVQINVKGYEAENGSFLDPAYTGDLTIYALKNSSQPFVMTDDGLESECWAIPTEWQYNDKFYYDESGTKVLIRPLLIDKNYPDGCISLLCNQWANANHKHGLENAKMYQVSTLPAGTYKISCFVPECVGLGGNLEAIVGATKGNGTLPDLAAVNGVWTPVDETAFLEDLSGNKAYCRLTDNKSLAYDKERGDVEFTLNIVLTETTEVTIGFVANVSMLNNTSKGGNVNISKMVVEREN